MRMYPEIAVEKAMKRQEIILRVYAKKISRIIEHVLAQYREKYFDFNVTHFVEKLHDEHSIEVSTHG